MENITKKLFIIFHGRFPNEKAASLFAAKSAESFADNGVSTTLIVPRRRNTVEKNPYDFYDTKRNYSLVYLPTIDLFDIPVIGYFAFHISYVFFSLSVFFYLKKHSRSKEDIVYSNETLPLAAASCAVCETLYELHNFPEKNLWLHSWLYSRLKWMLATNRWKMKEIKKRFDLLNVEVFYEPNAVDVDEFDVDASKEEVRGELKLPSEKRIVVYTGHLYSWKGADVLASAAKRLPAGVEVFFVGGTKGDVREYKKEFGAPANVHFVGFRPHGEIPLWQRAADVLVIPNTAKEDISKYYTSPMKLFEYMASKTPIVASNIPSIIEIVDDTCAFLFEPDNKEDLAQTIIYALENKHEAEERSKKAHRRVQKHSWRARAQRIIDVVYKHNA